MELKNEKFPWAIQKNKEWSGVPRKVTNMGQIHCLASIAVLPYSGRHWFASTVVFGFFCLKLFSVICIKFVLRSMLCSCGQRGIAGSWFQWGARCSLGAEPSVGNVSFFNSDLLVKMAWHQINLTLPKTHMDSNVYFLVNSGTAA